MKMNDAAVKNPRKRKEKASGANNGEMYFSLQSLKCKLQSLLFSLPRCGVCPISRRRLTRNVQGTATFFPSESHCPCCVNSGGIVRLLLFSFSFHVASDRAIPSPSPPSRARPPNGAVLPKATAHRRYLGARPMRKYFFEALRNRHDMTRRGGEEENCVDLRKK